MGINRIRLQDGAVVDPRMDARMQQTYQQNIAANQAQQARNEGIFQAARDKLQGFRNTLTEGVQAALNYGSIPANFAAGITGLPIGYTTQQMRDTMDAAARASTRRGPEGGMYVGYEDLGAQEGPGGEFLGMNKDMTSAQRALALTSGDVEFKIDPATGKINYDPDTLAYDFNQANPLSIGNEESGAITNFINRGGLMGQRVYTPMDSTFDPTMTQLESVGDTEKIARASQYGDAAATPTGDANFRPSIEGGSVVGRNIFGEDIYLGPTGKYEELGPSGYTMLSEEMAKVRMKEGQATQKPTMADVAGPATSSLIGPENLKNFPGATDRIEVWNPINKSWTSIGRDSPENRANAASMKADIAAKLGGEQGRKYLEQYDRNEASMYQGGRVGFQAGSTEEMIKAQEAAAQDPELDRIRQQLFGEGYVQDIGEGKGIAQYYSGFGLPQSLAFTPAPVEEVAPVADVIEPVVETGGGGGGTGGVDITTPDVGDAPINLDTPLTQMITTPTGDTMTVKEAFTQPEAYDIPGEMPKTPVSGAFGPFEYLQPETSDPFLMSGAAGGARLPQIGYGEGDVDPGLAQAAGLTTGYPEAAQQDPTFWENARDKFIETGQDIGNVFTNLKDQGIDIAKMAGSAIMNAIAPGLGFVMQALPEGGRSEMSDKLGEQYGMDDIGRLTGGPMAGYAVDSTFGKGIEQSTADVKNDVGNTLSEKYGFTKSELNQIAEGTYTGTKGYNEIMGKVTNLVDKYKDLSNFEKQIDKNKTAIDYDMEGTDEGDRAAEEAAEARKEGLEELSDIYSGIGQTRDAPSPTPQEIPDRGRGDGRDTGPTESPQGSGDPYGGGEGGVQSGLGSPDVGEVSSDAGFSEPSNQGGGGGGGGGKIVCTMMNDSYGFGSFRNKIWLRQSKNLAPEYQIGYHKIFLPLVRLSKTNKLLKKTLEHIAVHRTIDIRQEARGKVHLLGRVYRKVLEPICYWVGKNAKR